MDPTKDPCDNFYEFACGNYPNNIESSEINSILIELEHKIFYQEGVVYRNEYETPSPAINNMMIFRKKCFEDEEKDERETILDLVDEIQEMGGCPLINGAKWIEKDYDLTKAVSYMFKRTADTPFFHLHPVSLKRTVLRFAFDAHILKNTHDYFEEDNIDALGQYLFIIFERIKMILKGPMSEQEVFLGVKAIVDFEKQLAETIAYHLTTRRDDLKTYETNLNNLQRILIPAINWKTFFSENPVFPHKFASQVHQGQHFYFHDLNLAKNVSNVIMHHVDIKTLANYVVAMYIDKMIFRLGGVIRTEKNEMEATTKSGVIMFQSQMQMCYEMMDTFFPLVIDYLYMRHVVPSESFVRTWKMFAAIRSTMEELINKNAWMSESVKKKAIKKLYNTQLNVGALPEALDIETLNKYYEELSINEKMSFYQIASKLFVFRKERQFDTLFNRSGFIYNFKNSFMRAPTSTGLHNRQTNMIFLPAGILQPPDLEHVDLPSSLSYARVGFTIAHELNHDFDDEGSYYDENGFIHNWWDNLTRERFKPRQECLVNAFSKFRDPDINKSVNGNRTFTENFCDLNGLILAYKTYNKELKSMKNSEGESPGTEKTLPGFQKYTNQQLFFLAYATRFCDAYTKDEKLEILQGRHSLGMARVNVVLQHFPAFAKAWKCKAGSHMRPKTQCIF